MELEQVRAVDDRVVAIVRETARGRASGVKVDSRWGYVISMGDGKIVRAEAYRNSAQALEAAGLPASATDA